MIEMLHRTIHHVRILLNKLIKMPKFTNGTQITAGHLRISLYIISALFGVIVALIVFIYTDFVVRQNTIDAKQDQKLDKIYNELILSTSVNTITLEVIKDYLEHKDESFDFDQKINYKYQMLRSKQRGSYIQPDFNDAIVAFE